MTLVSYLTPSIAIIKDNNNNYYRLFENKYTVYISKCSSQGTVFNYNEYAKVYMSSQYKDFNSIVQSLLKKVWINNEPQSYKNKRKDTMFKFIITFFVLSVLCTMFFTIVSLLNVKTIMLGIIAYFISTRYIWFHYMHVTCQVLFGFTMCVAYTRGLKVYR